VECVEDGSGGRAASAEFAREVAGVGDSEAGEMRRETEGLEDVEDREQARKAAAKEPAGCPFAAFGAGRR
jgi:hypothetical protein